MVRIYLVRHGQTVYNVENRVQGWCDSPLTELGKAQAVEVGRKLSQIPFHRAYTGGLGRQEASACLILQENRAAELPILQGDRRFCEIGFGEFEGRAETELMQLLADKTGRKTIVFPELAKELSQHVISDMIMELDTSGQAEGGTRANARFRDGLRDVAQQACDDAKGAPVNVLIVTSGAMMGMYLEQADPMEKYDHMVRNGEIILLGYEEGELRLLKKGQNVDYFPGG